MEENLLTQPLQEELAEIQSQITALKAREADIRDLLGSAPERPQEAFQLSPLLSKILNFYPHIIYLYSFQQNRNLFLNRSVARDLGYGKQKAAELEKELLASLLHPDDFAKRQDYLKNLTDSNDGEIVQSEYRLRHKRGHWCWFRSEATVFRRDANGVPQEILGSTINISRQKEMHAELELSEKKYRTLYNKAPVMLQSIDKDQRLLSVSNRWTQVMGYNRKAVIGLPMPQFMTAESQKMASEILPKFFEKGYCKNIPYQFVKKNGDILEVELSAIAEKDESGTVVRTLAVLVDVTERNQINKALKEQHDLMNAVLSGLAEGVIVANTAAEFQIFNQRAERILRIGQTDTSPDQWSDQYGLFYPDTMLPIPEKELPMVKAIAGAATEDMEMFVRNSENPDGVYISVNGVPLKNRNDDLAGGVVTFRDITERKRDAEENRQRKLFLDSIFRGIQSAIFVIDVDENQVMRFTDLNPAHEKITGLTSKWIRGRTPEDLAPRVPEEVISVIRGHYERCLFSGKTIQYEEMIPFDGKETWWLTQLSPLKDENGNVFRIIGSSILISQMKRLQELTEELARSNAELEQFAYVASHDLKEPLRMVTSFLSLLERRYGENLPDEAKEFIYFAVDGGKRMQTLIDDLLLYSRIGKGKPAISSVSIGEVLNNTLLDLQVAIEEAQATINLPEELPVIRGNSNQVQQVFKNIISNALKFRENDRALEITVSVTRESDFWCFSIKDNGIGFDQRFADRIFQIFQRLHTRKEYHGTGIGLAVCYKIVQQMGGTIRALATKGQGAEFIFTLPASDELPGN